jgi:hypothetical protein
MASRLAKKSETAILDFVLFHGENEFRDALITSELQSYIPPIEKGKLILQTPCEDAD